MAAANSLSELQRDQACFLSIGRWLRLKTLRSKGCRGSCRQLPSTSHDRQLASQTDVPLEIAQVLRSATGHTSESQETVLYLGYGSNMCAETFRGRRNIKPLSQVNVLVQDLALTFDLPGIPYSEPCFANTRYRRMPSSNTQEKDQPDFHKDRWQKGLVGVVYEVTKADYAHIIATEGGGASYKDVVVDCFALSGDPTDDVPTDPSGTAFKAHTLFSPAKVVRPIASWAQPSPRYLKLITDGAEEHALPHEYRNYLNDIGTYTATTNKQRLGEFIFLSIWAPIFAFLFAGPAALFIGKDGKYPTWFARFAGALFLACWGSYDDFFKDIFGEGERTIEDGDEEDSNGDVGNEKAPLFMHSNPRYGAIGNTDSLV